MPDGSALPGWLSFDGHVTFSGTPLEADTPAVLDIVVTVGDDASPPAVDTTSFTLTVVEVNDVPVFEAEATDRTATEDVPFRYRRRRRSTPKAARSPTPRTWPAARCRAG